MFILLFVLLSSQISLADEASSVFFGNLKEGQVIGTSYMVKMGVKRMAVAPAGEVKPGQGHHHLIIDGDFIPEGQVVPMDATHLHFGKGQTEAELLLTAGKHKVTLQFADGTHKSYGKQMSATVNIVVENDIKTLR